MLQPSQIQDISVRYAAEIAEVRAFLRRAGTPVETETALHAMVERLETDASFHRDLGSHAWMLLYAGATVPEVLQVLAVAVAGAAGAGNADEDDAHEVLRFVMDSRRSMATRTHDRPSSSRPAVANPTAAAVEAAPTATITPSPLVSPAVARAAAPVAAQFAPAGAPGQTLIPVGETALPRIQPAEPAEHLAERPSHAAESVVAAPFSGAFRFSRAATLPHAERTDAVPHAAAAPTGRDQAAEQPRQADATGNAPARAAANLAPGPLADAEGHVSANAAGDASAASAAPPIPLRRVGATDGERRPAAASDVEDPSKLRSGPSVSGPNPGPVSVPRLDPTVAQQEPSVVDQPLPKRSVRSDESATRPRRRWFGLVAVFAVVLGLGGAWWYQRNADDGADVRGPAVPAEQNAVQPVLQPGTQSGAPQYSPYALPEVTPGRVRSLKTRPAYDAPRTALPQHPGEPPGKEQVGAARSDGAASGPSYAGSTTAPAPIVRMPGTPSTTTAPRLTYRPSTATGGRSIVQPIPSSVISSRLDSPSVNDADALDNRVEGTRGYPRLLRRQQLDANGTLVASMSAPPVTTAGNARTVPIPSGTVRSTALGISAGNLVYAPDPAYPSAAASQHVSGQVTVQAMVDRDGTVASARVVSGPPLLRDAAVNAVQQWRYRPFLAGGKPQTFTATAVMDFQLK